LCNGQVGCLSALYQSHLGMGDMRPLHGRR
jgi:hypothetical protein